MKATKITCIVYRDASARVSAALGHAGVAHTAVQSGRSVVLRERRRLFGLSSTRILEDDPVDIYRAYVKPAAADGLLRLVAERAGLAEAGRGSVYSEDVDLDGDARSLVDAGPGARSRGGPRLTGGLVGICCIVQRGQASPIIRSLLEAGAVPTVTFGEGMGVRDKLGLLRIAIPAEKEVISAVVSRYDAEEMMSLLIDVGRLDQPGKGFIYLTPIRSGIINTKTQRGMTIQGASMEQVVSAIDHLQGSAEWRKMEAVASAKAKRRFLRDLVNFRLLTNDGRAVEIVQAAMAVGAPGATISRYRQSAGGGESSSTAREMSDLIVGRARVGEFAETVRKAGLYAEETAGLVEKATVTLACTYLGPG